MDRYYTLMIIPEREKGVRTIRIPRLVFRSFTFLTAIFFASLLILGYDYYQIMQQVYENKHLNIENRQLKDQIQNNQMKVNSLTHEINRIHTFEKKLRIITGIEKLKEQMPPIEGLEPDTDDEAHPEQTIDTTSIQQSGIKKVEVSSAENLFELNLDFKDMQNDQEYLYLKKLYDQKLAAKFGLQTGHTFTREWSELTNKSFQLSAQYAQFDYQYNKIIEVTKNLEVHIHELDQYLLDKDSFLKSTPTLFPTLGWVTSYYGPRKSPYSGKVRMHEGIDIGARPGTKVLAPADGVISFSGAKAGFGKLVQIDHGYGIETYFGHNSSVHVKAGQNIKRGEIIAKVGNTGRSTGPHVHYEVRVNGIAVDPLYYILD